MLVPIVSPVCSPQLGWPHHREKKRAAQSVMYSVNSSGCFFVMSVAQTAHSPSHRTGITHGLSVRSSGPQLETAEKGYSEGFIANYMPARNNSSGSSPVRTPG